MDHSLYRLDRLKTVFAKYRPQNTTDDADNKDEGLFNIPKLNVMTHYVAFIRLHGSAQGFDTSSPESAHRTHLKDFFPRTNGNEGWETQMLAHNVRWHRMMAMNDIQTRLKTKETSVPKERWKVGLTTANRDPTKLPGRLAVLDEETLTDLGLCGRGWCRAGDIADDDEFGCLEFIDALAVSIREKRKAEDKRMCSESEPDSPEKDPDTRERDPTWARDYIVGIPGSLTCWRREGKDATNLNLLEPERVRCAYHWKESNQWRKDTGSG